MPKVVQVSGVVTEQEFLHKSSDLETCLTRQSFAQFCEGKVEGSADSTEQSMWNFLKVGAGHVTGM